MAVDLDGVRQKLERAQVHLEALRAKIGPGTQRTVDLDAEFDEALTGYRIVFRGHQEWPSDVGVIFGDFIHNTRSSLDHLVASVLRMNGIKVRKYHCFPMCVSEDEFRATVSDRPRDAGPSALDGLLIEQIKQVALHQPFNGRDARQARRSPLYLLHLAWNADKHRQVHIGRAHLPSFPIVNIRLGPAPYFKVLHFQPTIRPGAYLQPQSVIAYVRVGKRPDAPEGLSAEMEMNISSVVAFRSHGLTIEFGNLSKMLIDASAAARAFDPSFPEFGSTLG